LAGDLTGWIQAVNAGARIRGGVGARNDAYAAPRPKARSAAPAARKPAKAGKKAAAKKPVKRKGKRRR
ncbi:MAG TPA: hypothetical protein VK746_02240, partial [Candidatus Eisenbacteria bacterium]|nr:hypothetical protein [Candidatus Eisenbacteria bacterium]